ncbi:MAG: ATP-binding cassette domain-containing protein [Acidimicrobiia bacterium]|nr:ATP-binding cassette domain-containing protein [Acidimicrobiia bacterium]
MDEVLGQVGAIDVRDRHPFQLSGGQTQRVAIASVLATSPDVLVLDEPTSQLDPMGSDEVLDVLIALQRAGATVLVATHDRIDLAPAADRLMILDAGSVVADGAPREVIGQLLESTMIRSPRVAQIFRQLQLRRRVPEDMPLALGIDEVVAALREAGA